jgi:hypothetical protein
VSVLGLRDPDSNPFAPIILGFSCGVCIHHLLACVRDSDIIFPFDLNAYGVQYIQMATTRFGCDRFVGSCD